jgi:hypothetical protein
MNGWQSMGIGEKYHRSLGTQVAMVLEYLILRAFIYRITDSIIERRSREKPTLAAKEESKNNDIKQMTGILVKLRNTSGTLKKVDNNDEKDQNSESRPSPSQVLHDVIITDKIMD